MNTKALNELAALICRAQEQDRTPMGIAFAIDAAGWHMLPEVAAELERLSAQVVELADGLKKAEAAAARARRERDLIRERVSEPFGCTHCGEAQRSHGRRYLAGVGVHGWERPSDEQVKARMLARRAARLPLPTVPELDLLRSELAVSEQRSERRRIAWRMARQRAISVGGAADRYAAHAREGQTALQDMLAALLTAQIERDAAQARVEELLTERRSTNESVDDAAKALREQRDRIAELEALTPARHQTCQVCGAGYVYGEPCAQCEFRARMAAESQARVRHDLPELGGQR